MYEWKKKNQFSKSIFSNIKSIASCLVRQKLKIVQPFRVYCSLIFTTQDIENQPLLSHYNYFKLDSKLSNLTSKGNLPLKLRT